MQCPLTSLDLTGVPCVDDNLISILATTPAKDSLEVSPAPMIHSYYCELNSDHVKVLKLRNCTQVTDSSLELLSLMPNLVVLDIVGCLGCKEQISSLLVDGRFKSLAILYLGPKVHSKWLSGHITPETLHGRLRLNVYVNDICVVPWL